MATAYARPSRSSGFDLSEPAQVTFSVMDEEGNEVRRIVDDRELGGRTPSTASGGTGATTTARRVPDGLYRMRVVRRDEGRVIDSFKEITVDTRPRAPSSPRATRA